MSAIRTRHDKTTLGAGQKVEAGGGGGGVGRRKMGGGSASFEP